MRVCSFNAFFISFHGLCNDVTALRPVTLRSTVWEQAPEDLGSSGGLPALSSAFVWDNTAGKGTRYEAILMV